jgi:hypothetical protein
MLVRCSHGRLKVNRTRLVVVGESDVSRYKSDGGRTCGVVASDILQRSAGGGVNIAQSLRSALSL